MNKSEIIERIIDRLQEELAAVTASAQAAREAATHEESKAEDQHDTRGLEASYLAGAQAGRALELQKTIMAFRQLELRDFGAQDRIAAGAIVELEQGRTRTICFVVPFGGGLSVPFDGRTLQLITPQSPLGEELIGRKAGSEFEIEARGGTREYRVISVR